MKKTYKTPEMTVVVLSARNTLMAGSLGGESAPQNISFSSGYYTDDTEGNVDPE